MNLKIEKGSLSNLDDCVEALVKSELGTEYFSNKEKAIESMKEGLEKDQVFVAYNDDGICVGFIWYILNGAFHAFPYLHIIAVKKEFRSMGIGKDLMEFFENIVMQEYSKIFLVVADFNPKAKELYEKLGYEEVGKIPDLYKQGITECLMMKCKKNI